MSEGVAKAKWEALESDNVESALGAMVVDGVGALITVLGAKGYRNNNVPASPLINLSDELIIPRAILTHNKNDRDYLRADSSDIIIRTNNAAYIPAKVTKWLLGITSR